MKRDAEQLGSAVHDVRKEWSQGGKSSSCGNTPETMRNWVAMVAMDMERKGQI